MTNKKNKFDNAFVAGRTLLGRIGTWEQLAEELKELGQGDQGFEMPSKGINILIQDPLLDKREIEKMFDGYQEKLIAGVNIKTINEQSLLGSGDIQIKAGVSDFNEIPNRPKYAGQMMTDATDIPDVDKVIDDLDDAIQEVNTLKNGIDTLNQNLQDEISNRQVEDSNLQDKIDDEESARKTADQTLQSAINDERTERQSADTTLQTTITNNYNTLDNKIDTKIAAEAHARANADANKVDKVSGKGLSTNDFTNLDKDKLDSAIQPDNINYTVLTDVKMKSTASTTSVTMEGNKVNLKEGTPSDFEIPLPVASSTQAGVMNTATYDTIQSNTAKINAIENGAVAITGISTSPDQNDLSDSWKTATGQTTLINGASILDVDNNLRWTYYTNSTTWYSADTSASVTINPFTNTEAGTIKGSNVDGQVHAETDGTGSVQGWDTVKSDIATHTSQIGGKVDKESGKGLSTNDYSNTDKAIVNGITAALAGKQDNLTAGAGIDSRQMSSDKVEVDDTVVMYEQPGSTPSKVDFVATANIQDKAVTTAKIDDAAITNAKLAPQSVKSSNIDFTTLNIMTISGSYDYSSCTSNSVIALQRLVNSSGTKLTHVPAQHGIKIGAGVNKVLVSASVFYSGRGGSAYGYFCIRKNEHLSDMAGIANTVNSSYGSATIPLILLDVVENDVISLWNLDKTIEIHGKRTYLTIIAL